MRELMVSLGRRWYLVIVAIVLTAGACLGVSQLVPPQYEAKASLVLLPPKSTEDPTANRFLLLQQLGQASGVVIRALNADETHQVVAGDTAAGATYTVEPDYTTNAPILVITVNGRTAADASRLLDAVEGQVPLQLTRLQDQVAIAAGARITAVPVTTAGKPKLVTKKQLRAVVATGVGLAGLLALLVGAFDGYRQRRTSQEPLEDEGPVAVVDQPEPTRPVDITGSDRRRGRRQESRPAPVPSLADGEPLGSASSG